MAMADTVTLPKMDDRQERTGRRKPFSTWVKKLANFKNGSSSSSEGRNGHFRRDAAHKASKKRTKNNNPYPQSGHLNVGPQGPQSDPSLTTNQTGLTSNYSLGQSRRSIPSSTDGALPQTAGGMWMAPTVSADHEDPHSIRAPSHMASSATGTSRTANGGIDSRKGGDSTFSSPAPSVRSLTTTLTTIQSVNPAGAAGSSNTNGQSSMSHNNNQTIQFSQPFPSAPASAIPAHLAPHAGGPGHPTTYNMATANNMLTDNASILTLASSSKRRRRRSMDTDASVRALAPSSLWGGSRESLPLSVLSANMDGGIPPTPGLHQSTSRLVSNERTSIYSTTGIAPALPGERNSIYTGKQSMTGDGASIRSGLLGHGRADSMTGSVAGVNSPLASPREVSENYALGERDENWNPRRKEEE